MPKYDAPDFMTRNVFNPLLALATKLGLSMKGSRILTVRGRKSGQPRTTVVAPIEVDGQRYLVAPRGNTEWVRNLRAAGEGDLRLGRKHERFTAAEIPDGEKPPVLRPYLVIWKSEMNKFFNGVSADSPEDELLREAADHPVFRLSPQA
jgi:deazaflavin-dependent oxidoreductase (nitroreductase family)